jgi:hypothetical protein
MEENAEERTPTRKLVTAIIILFFIINICIVGYILINKEKTVITLEEIECISNKSTFYSQLGCTHCIKQEKEFGEYLYLLNKVDCFYNSSICIEKQIRATPTWEIDGKMIEGYYKLSDLKIMTGC